MRAYEIDLNGQTVRFKVREANVDRIPEGATLVPLDGGSPVAKGRAPKNKQRAPRNKTTVSGPAES